MGARKIAFLNCKGGVGKTSLAVNVAAALVKYEKQRVLLVDMDAQSNASIWLMGLPRWSPLEGMLEKTVCGFFKTNTFLSEAIHQSVLEGGIPVHKLLPGLDLIPSTFDLLDLDHEFQESKGADTQANSLYLTFYNQIQPLVDSYDYIIFDCPPALGRASKCAAFCSPEIYVPALPDFLSSLGIKLLSDRLTRFLVQARLQGKNAAGWKSPKIRGVILNAVPGGAKVDNAKELIRARLAKERGKPAVANDACIIKAEIRDTVVAAKLAGKTASSGIPAVLAESDNPGLADDYAKVARYIHTNSP